MRFFAICALPLVAACHGRSVAEPTYLEVEAGQDAAIGVVETPSSGSIYARPYGAAVFASSNPGVATVEGSIDGPPWTGTAKVHGMAPGIAYLSSSWGDGNPIATIEVFACDGTLPDVGEPHRYVVAPVGSMVELVVTAATSSGHPKYNFFSGEVGDRTHPLAGVGNRVWYRIAQPAASQVWAEVVDRCGTKTVAFHISPQPRRRSGR
jgi:hypothetical protein